MVIRLAVETCAFTELLIDTLDRKRLWEEHGVDDDILVSVYSAQ